MGYQLFKLVKFVCVCLTTHDGDYLSLTHTHTHTHTFIYTHPGMIGDYFRWWRKWRIHADSPFSHSRNLTTRLKLPVSRRNNGPPWPQSPGPFFSNYPDIHSWFIKSSFKKKYMYIYIYLFIYLFDSLIASSSHNSAGTCVCVCVCVCISVCQCVGTMAAITQRCAAGSHVTRDSSWLQCVCVCVWVCECVRPTVDCSEIFHLWYCVDMNDY